jgi:hypothetical protein
VISRGAEWNVGTKLVEFALNGGVHGEWGKGNKVFARVDGDRSAEKKVMMLRLWCQRGVRTHRVCRDCWCCAVEQVGCGQWIIQNRLAELSALIAMTRAKLPS